jgi:hypothetical protein
MGKLYQDQMCRLGGNVERIQLAGERRIFQRRALRRRFICLG